MTQTSIHSTDSVPVGLGSRKIHLNVGPFACTTLMGVGGFANELGDEAHAINESPISYPWVWITLIAIISLLAIRFLYIKTIFNLKASKLLSKELGLRNYRTLENLSKYDVFKHIMAVNTYGNNLLIDQGKKRGLLELEKILMRYLIERAEINKFQIKDIIEKIHAEKDALTNDETIDWLLGLNINEKHTVLDGSPWINEATGEQEVYQGAFYSVIRQIVDRLDFNKNEVFYDLGSGYGRVPLYFAITTKLNKIKGIELIEKRVNECNRVRDSLELNQVEFVKANAKEYDFSDGDIFFMFNPFTEESLECVVNKLREISKKKPIRIISFGLCNIYMNKQLNWLTLTETIKWKSKVYGQGVLFFESRLH
jgi:SAM-dependent methyltransferase